VISAVVRPVVASLSANPMRTALSVLAIGIGIAAVICTAALGAAASGQVQDQIDALGEDFLWIRPGDQRVSGARTGAGTDRSLTVEDAAALAELPDIAECSPIVSGREQVISGGRNWNTRYQGVLPAYFAVRRRTLAAGTWFADADVTAARRVLVLGAGVSTRLFEAENPVGRTIRMGRFPFTVIGVLAPRGADRSGVDRDDVVFTPITTSLRNLDRRDSVSDIMCGVVSPDRMASAEEEAAALLRWRHGWIAEEDEDDFEIQHPLETVVARAATTRTMALLLTGIGAVSLVVGGVGIMNIMLVSVTERRREIGLRLAVGARVGAIRGQFLMEAAALGLAGAVCGCALGYVVAVVMTYGFGWSMVLTPEATAVASAVAVGAALVFGYYPAHAASRLDPIEALRSEA
jgi:putative ABC transport system permease protein